MVVVVRIRDDKMVGRDNEAKGKGSLNPEGQSGGENDKRASSGQIS